LSIAKEVGRKLRKARLRADLSQQDVADRLKLAKVTYGNMERGTSLASLEHLVKLPSILGCKIVELLPDSVVTPEDRQRAADPRLQEIEQLWNKLDDDEKDLALDQVKILAKRRG